MEQASVETVLCIPHNQFRFKYKLNDGSFHYVDKFEAYKFFLQFMEGFDKMGKKTLLEFLHSFLPFIIIPKDKIILELKKGDSVGKNNGSLDNISERDLIRYAQEMKSVPDRIPNDSQLDRLNTTVKNSEQK